MEIENPVNTVNPMPDKEIFAMLDEKFYMLPVEMGLRATRVVAWSDPNRNVSTPACDMMGMPNRGYRTGPVPEGSGLIPISIIDVDNIPLFEEHYPGMIENELMKGFVEKSPKGYHYLFKYNADLDKFLGVSNFAGTLYTHGFEISVNNGSYCVAAGSKVLEKDGTYKEYRLLNVNWDLPDPPEQLIRDAIRSKKEMDAAKPKHQHTSSGGGNYQTRLRTPAQLFQDLGMARNLSTQGMRDNSLFRYCERCKEHSANFGTSAGDGASPELIDEMLELCLPFATTYEHEQSPFTTQDISSKLERLMNKGVQDRTLLPPER